MVFFLKYFMVPLMRPLSLVLLFLLLALMIKRARVGLIAAAVLLLFLFGYPLLPRMLHQPLVSRYASVTAPLDNITNIVVLACGSFATDPAIPANGRADRESLYRFLEGVRLHRDIPGSRLLVSVSHSTAPAEAVLLLDDLADLAGVDREKVLAIAGAHDTREEALLMRGLVGTNQFYLVTSDYHMRRSMMTFEQQGMHPLPAPAGSCGRGEIERPLMAESFFPSAGNIRNADQAIHEYIGLFWAKLVGERGAEVVNGRR